MAESTQGSEFSEEQLLTLSVDRALRIWYVITGREIFRNIEWNCLSSELLSSHHCLFATIETEKLTAGMPSCKQAVDSAVRRTPQSVLHAVYKSLLDTQTCGGAIHHVSVAEEIQKEVMQQTQPTAPMSATHTPANEQRWPSRSQLAAAVPDKGLHVGKDATAKSSLLQNGEAPQLDLTEDKKLSRLESSTVENNQQTLMAPVQVTANPPAADVGWSSVSKLASAEHDRADHGMKGDTDRAQLHPTTLLQTEKTSEMNAKSERQKTISEAATCQPASSSTLAHLQGSPQDKMMGRLESYREDTIQQTESQPCGSGVPEEWEVIVKFIQITLGKNPHKDVFPTLLNELKASHFLRFTETQEELSAALQRMVKERRMSWFCFAQYLLRSERTRPFIFAFADHTMSIRDVFKQALKRHLGGEWYQLATAMKIPKTEIDSINQSPHELVWKINCFLTKYKLPSFKSDRKTAEFIIEALERASLPTIATDVMRDLEHDLKIEGLTASYLPDQRPEHGIFGDAGASFSADAACDYSPQDFETIAQETLKQTQMARRQSATPRLPMKRLPADSTDFGPECGMKKNELAVIPVTQNDDGYEAFALFDDSKSEDDIIETISSAKYSGVCLARQEDNKQLVHFAAERGYANVLRKLHQAGHDITAKMKDGQTPFLLACEAGHADTVTFLLTCDRNIVNTKDSRDRSCLHFPAMLRNKDLMYDLIWDWRAKIDAESITGITPLSVGCVMGDLPIVQKLVHNLKLSHCRKHCKASRLPPLHAAAFGGHQHIMEYLLTLQGEEACESIRELLHPDYRSEHQYTALHIAACKGHLQIVEMLVEMCNCAVNPAAQEATTPLLLAAASGHEDVVEYLLDHGADMNSMREVKKGTFHLTPLGEAALGRHVEVVRLLLDRGADYTFKAGGTTSILALACIGGNQEIVQLLLSILGSEIEQAYERNELHEIFEMPFVVSMDFLDYKCARQLLGHMPERIRTLDDIIRVFSKKAQPRMINLLKQYKEAVAAIPDSELPNQGDTCRRVAGSRSSSMYHLCYDDGPHWATEPMQLCFMFESLNKPERFHDVYEEVYVAASKCILHTLMQQGYSTEELASIAHEKGSEEAAQFFLGYHENQSRFLFLEQVHSGNPSAMGVCCELVSAGILQEICTSDDVGLVAQQYFMEMSKRDLKHPGQFGMKFSSHGGTGTGVRLQRNGQAAPIRRPPRSLHHSTPVQKHTAGATPAPDSSRTRPQVWASGKVATPSATGPLDEEPMIPQVSASKKLDTASATLPLEARPPVPQVSASKDLDSRPAAVPLEANPPTVDAAGSMNPPYIPDPQRLKMDAKQTSLDATEKPGLSCNVIPDSDLCLPVVCTQLNDSDDSWILPLHKVSSDCERLKTRCSPFIAPSSAPTRHRELDSLTPSGHLGWSHRSDEQRHLPDVRAALVWSDSSTADTGGANDSKIEYPPPSSSPLPKVHQLSQSQSASVTRKSGVSIGSEHTSKNAPPHVETPSGVRSQSHASHGNCTPDQSGIAPNILWELAEKSGYSSQLSQHQKTSAEKSVCVTAPGLKQHCDPTATSEPVINVKGSCDLPSPHHSLQKPSAPAPLARSPGPVHSSVTPPRLSSQHPNSSAPLAQSHSPDPVNSSRALPHITSQQPNSSAPLALSHSPGPVHALQQPNSSASLMLPHSPISIHSSAAPAGPTVSRPDTIGGGFEDDVPPAPPVNAAAAPVYPDIDEGFPDSESVERDSVAARPLTQPPATNSAQFMQTQNSHQTGSPAKHEQTHPSTIPTKEHNLSSTAAGHPTQQDAPESEGTSKEETNDDDDDDDTHSDFTYQSSTASGSAAHNLRTEDSRSSSLSQVLHPSVAGMQPRTSPLLTVNHPVTPALGTAGSGKMTSFVDTHAACPHSNATGDEQSQNSGQSVQMSVISREQQLSNPATHPSQQSALNEDSFDGETSDDDDARSDVTYQSSASAMATHTRANHLELPLSGPTHPPAHHSQPTTNLHNRSVNVSSHMEPAKVRLPPSEVPSMIDKSAETYPSAATVVEAAHEADIPAVPASSSPAEQLVAVSSGEGCPPVLSTVKNVYRQDSGYLGSHHFVSSNILHRHPDSMEPSDRMPMDSYQREQDSQESVQHAEPLLGLSKMNSEEMLASVKEEEMLAYVSRQVGQKWSMLARYAGLEEDEIQRIKRSAQDRPRTTVKKILERLTWNELLNVVQKHMHMLNTAAKLQHFLGHPVDALPDLVQNELDPQQYSRTLLLASQCVSEHWKELAQYLGVDPHQHWDVLEESSDADEKCHEVLLLWLSSRSATLHELLEAVESTSAAAGSLQQLIEMARSDGQH